MVLLGMDLAPFSMDAIDLNWAGASIDSHRLRENYSGPSNGRLAFLAGGSSADSATNPFVFLGHCCQH